MSTSLVDDADRFVDLACLTYLDNESRARRREAQTLLAARPALVTASAHAAAAAGDPDALREHLDRDPAAVGAVGSPRSWVPLLALCYSRVRQRDAIACLELLLARGADPNAHVLLCENTFTALTGVMGEGEAGPIEQPPHHYARAMAERLLDAGASPNESQGLYNTHFLPSTAWLELLLARGLTTDLDYLLGQAVEQGFVERVRILLAHGASPDGRNHYNKRTNLANALLEGHAEIARMLEAAGAKPVALTDDELHANAVFAAARHGRLDALQRALSRGLSIGARDACGLTPRHHAARAGHVDVVRELVARGAPLDARDPRYDGTPLGHARHFAERWPSEGRTMVVSFLEAQPSSARA